MKTIYTNLELEVDLLTGQLEEVVHGDDLNNLAEVVHRLNNHAGWWHDIETGDPLERNVGELICLMHSELSEAMEADRKNLMDDKLPHRKGLEVEFADLIIRVLDVAGASGMDIGGALVEKLEYNLSRADHKPENRIKEGGKKY